jgi:hypothetical protein
MLLPDWKLVKGIDQGVSDRGYHCLTIHAAIVTTTYTILLSSLFRTFSSSHNARSWHTFPTLPVFVGGQMLVKAGTQIEAIKPSTLCVPSD